MRSFLFWLFVIGLAAFASFSYAFERSCQTDEILSAARHELDQIRSYRVVVESEISGRRAKSEIQGRPPRVMRIEMSMLEPNLDARWIHFYDGEFQWIENRVQGGVEVLRVTLSKVTTLQRPFDTGYALMGSGLLSGEDYLSTIKTLLALYQLRVTCSSDEFLFTGTLQVDKLQEYANSRTWHQSDTSLVDRFRKQFSSLELTLRADNFLLQRYALSDGDGNHSFVAEFREITVNDEVQYTLAEYTPPTGINVVDITDELIQMYRDQP